MIGEIMCKSRLRKHREYIPFTLLGISVSATHAPSSSG